jgi:hypothetical protein
VNKTLSAVKLGDKGQAVLNLQGFLVEKGFLERKFITGNYLGLTAKAVMWFQLYHHDMFDIEIPEILDLKGEWFGAQSVKVAKTLLSR